VCDPKGGFVLADRRYCYPLTITDFARYLLFREAMETTKEHYAFSVFERAFKGFGMRLASVPAMACASPAQVLASA
jgi:putative transposase